MVWRKGEVPEETNYIPPGKANITKKTGRDVLLVGWQENEGG